MSTKYSKSNLSKLSGKTNIEVLRLELYSIITDVLLSKEYFNKNSDIVNFTNKVNLNYADYLFRSRTLLLARILRDVKKADKKELIIILRSLQLLMFNNVEPDSDEKAEKAVNYIDSLMEQFKRGSGND
ncbi:hypothetical protein [Bacillus altitudinis]|uniref:hypothetical protein n=1 Tax=Bacillus altitudinis TaxID=293387 RepID=UPI002F952AFC